jgi:hypothetical protein
MGFQEGILRGHRVIVTIVMAPSASAHAGLVPAIFR